MLVPKPYSSSPNLISPFAVGHCTDVEPCSSQVLDHSNPRLKKKMMKKQPGGTHEQTKNQRDLRGSNNSGP